MSTFRSIFILLLVTSCSASNPEQSPEHDKSKIESSDSVRLVEYNKRFFGNDSAVSLDSLARLINNADKVVAYNWNDNSGNAANCYSYIVDAYGEFDRTTGGGVQLSRSQIDTLVKILCDTTTYSGSISTSHVSHVAFVYYDIDGKIIGQSNINFLGYGILSVPKLSEEGLSKIGTDRIFHFCKSIPGISVLENSMKLTY